MSLYRIGKGVLELKVIGTGYRVGTPQFPEPPAWVMPSKAMRNLIAFGKAGWAFQKGTDVEWGAVHALHEGGLPSLGLLAEHPSKGLVILRDHLVLQFQPSIGAERIAERLRSYSGFRALELGENLFEVGLSLPPDHDLEGYIHRELTSLLQDPEVIFAEPSILYHIGPPDPPDNTLDGPNNKWHWEKIDLLAAWKAGGEWGKGRRVAVIDAGFHTEDPQIKPNVGWKLTLDPYGRVITKKPMPAHSHGTMCAGLIGAIRDGSEVNGAAPSCTLGLMALSDFCVCTQVALGIALRMCAGLPCLTEGVPKGEGADVISCSLGITSSNWELSDPLRMAIDSVVKEGRGGKGTPIVWATFDADETIEPCSVEGYEPLIVVSQSNEDDERVMSGWGKGLDLLAPGALVSVISYDAMGQRWVGRHSGGSSLAAPCVAGVAALALAVNPNLTREQVAAVITSTCDPPMDSPIWNDNTGWGRLNAKRAVELAKLMLKESHSTDGCSGL
jgi:subtilisin family serine protease